MAVLGTVLVPRPAAADATSSDRLGTVCEYGINLAFRGELAASESVFISLLSLSHRDPRALANLGNLHLLRGDLKDALGFFGRANKIDGKDPGIVLNRAIAYLLLGEDELALDAAEQGIGMAGGLGPAASLLGIRLEGRASDSVKTGARVYLSKNEIRALLEAAAAGIPSDSLSVAGAAAPPSPPKKGRKRIWRTAGTRGGESRDAVALIYWKR